MDTVKQKMHVTDPIEIIDKSYYDDSSILTAILFIDHNKHSQFHPDMSIRDEDRRLLAYSETDSTLEKDSILLDKDSAALVKKLVPQELKKSWIPVYKYKNNFYLYKPCGLGDAIDFRITDTAVYFCYLETYSQRRIRGIYPHRDGSATIHVLPEENEIRIRSIDNTRSIYVVKIGDNLCHYYIPMDKANNFPIILTYCNEIDAIELKHDHAKCQW
jgi:hypothetical protein